MALVKGASYKKHTPDKGSSNPRMRAKAKHSAMLERAKSNRAEAKKEKTVLSKVSAAAKERKNTARKNKTGVFAVKSHAAKIADSKKATKARNKAKMASNSRKILKDRSPRTRTKVTQAQRARVQKLASEQTTEAREKKKKKDKFGRIQDILGKAQEANRGRARTSGPGIVLGPGR